MSAPEGEEPPPLSEEQVRDMHEIEALKDQFLKAIGKFGNSRELSIAKTKIEEAAMWTMQYIAAR